MFAVRKRRLSPRGLRRLAIAAAGAALASLCIAASPVSASASTIPILFASEGQQAHHCAVLGQPDRLGNEGVVCVDLIAEDDEFGDVLAVSQVEGLCQNINYTPAKVVKCDAIDIYATLANAVTGAGTRIEVTCTTNCPSTTRQYWPIEYDYVDITGNCTTDLDDNFWSVIYGQGALTYIQLPGSHNKVYLSSLTPGNDSGNLSSGHYQICP